MLLEILLILNIEKHTLLRLNLLPNKFTISSKLINHNKLSLFSNNSNLFFLLILSNKLHPNISGSIISLLFPLRSIKFNNFYKIKFFNPFIIKNLIAFLVLILKINLPFKNSSLNYIIQSVFLNKALRSKIKTIKLFLVQLLELENIIVPIIKALKENPQEPLLNQKGELKH